MIKILAGFFSAGLLMLGGWAVFKSTPVYAPQTQVYTASSTPNMHEVSEQAHTTVSTQTQTTSSSRTTTKSVTSSSSGGRVYTKDELLAIADNTLADGTVPLGDYRYVTDAPKKGYVYLCNVHKDNPGSMVNGPWISGSTWNFLKKVTIDGAVSWPQAVFTNVVSGTYRVLTGNDLPINHTTGVFPVASSDDAHQYDANPNTISAQTIKQTLPVDPVYSNTPYCMGGEVGIMLSGVALFNAFDAGLRDAPAHELQDSCDGHPQGTGMYHYHSMSSCMKDVSVFVVLGYAYDGFPITGPKVAEGKYLTTDDLDECHGLTSTLVVDGKEKVTYHYVMTQDFPYSASCFRGKPVTTGPGGAPMQQSAANQGGSTQGTGSGQGGGQPPQEAIDACSGKAQGASCAVTTPNGTLSGTCRIPPNFSLACVPN